MTLFKATAVEDLVVRQGMVHLSLVFRKELT